MTTASLHFALVAHDRYGRIEALDASDAPQDGAYGRSGRLLTR